MPSYIPPQPLYVPATEQNFDESGYLLANPDVAAAVKAGQFEFGRQHFNALGKAECRRLRVAIDPLTKSQKLARIESLLRSDLAMRRAPDHFDFLTAELRQQFNIIDTSAVSSHEYDPYGMTLIERHRDGLILDCGAGSRGVYYQNVVNFEIAQYPSTDVRGVGEVLPFRDASFDAVISIAVLEHVKDPWRCAQEIIRVLKPGGELLCCVPFLQPMHGYPHHYYNMTGLGLRNLFQEEIDISRSEVPLSTGPIWALTWILNSWASGLSDRPREEFMNLRVAELMSDPMQYLSRDFVVGLSEEKNMELASATMILGRKRA